MPKLNFISDDSVKDKIISWQETMAATKQKEALEKQTGEMKKEDVGDAEAIKSSDESKDMLNLESSYF